jgi:hypothetical protein
MTASVKNIPTDSNPPPVAPEGYDPFSYPHLYPSGWNLEDLPANEASASEPQPASTHSSMPSWYEPFWDLRTFPSGWDLP